MQIMTNDKTREAFESWLLNGNRFRTEPKDIFEAGYQAASTEREELVKELEDLSGITVAGLGDVVLYDDLCRVIANHTAENRKG